jgi:hypothetical protein
MPDTGTGGFSWAATTAGGLVWVVVLVMGVLSMGKQEELAAMHAIHAEG